MLRFSLGNKKLTHGEAIFDLPAGHACPFAKECQSLADRLTGKIKDGKNNVFRCYAASAEIWKPVRIKRWNNFEQLRKCKTSKQMADLIIKSMPDSLRYRIHSSGDFFSQMYFDAWMYVAKQFPERIFYTYTKALPFWIKRMKEIPSNFVLVASYGGTHDRLIFEFNLKYAKVVYSEKQAEELGLEIDHDDFHAWKGTKSFALLIHGTQPKGSLAAKALKIC